MRARRLVRARVSPSILCFVSAAGRLKPVRIAVLGRLELFGDGVSTVDAGVGWRSRLVSLRAGPDLDSREAFGFSRSVQIFAKL